MTAYNFPTSPHSDDSRSTTRSDTGYISTVAKSRFWRLGKSFDRDTTAELKYSQTAGNRLFLMCGANASVIASGYAVVKVEKDKDSEVNYIVQDNAKILW